MSLRSPTTPLLPSTIPGLLRLGSPVIYHEDPAVDLGWVGAGVVVNLWTLRDWPMADICCRSGAPRTGLHLDRSKPSDRRTIDLDLADATGRAHALWWLAGQTQAVWGWTLGVWCVKPALRGAMQFAGSSMNGGHASSVTVVPALQALDPHDARRLGDNSLWVDAEALRVVCEHVAAKGLRAQ